MAHISKIACVENKYNEISEILRSRFEKSEDNHHCFFHEDRWTGKLIYCPVSAYMKANKMNTEQPNGQFCQKNIEQIQNFM